MNVQAIYTKPRPPYVRLKDRKLDKELGYPGKDGGGEYRIIVTGKTETHLIVSVYGLLPKNRVVHGTVPIGWPEQMNLKKVL